MDGRYPKNAGAIFRVCRMDGKFLLLQNSHFRPPWRSYPKTAGAIFRVCRMDGKFLLLQNLHSRLPWRSYLKNAGAILVVGFIALVLLLIEHGDK